MSMLAEMEKKEKKPNSVIYGCVQGIISSFFLTETPTDSKAEQTKVIIDRFKKDVQSKGVGLVESTNDNKPESLKHTERKKRTGQSQSGTRIEQEQKRKFCMFRKVLTETPTDSKAEQTKVESTNDNKPESLKHSEGNTWEKKRTAQSQSGTRIEQLWKQKFCIFQKGLAAKKKLIVLVLIFVMFSTFDTTYGYHIESSIETSPIILGKDARFKCSIESSNSMSFPLLSTGWLKGSTKLNIIYNNISTNQEKYTPEIYREADRDIYIMTILNVSLSDLDTYTCEFGFKSATLLFTMERNRPFIYFPGNNDTVYNISKTEMNVLIERKCQEPYCIALYNDEDITKSMIKVDNPEATTYSTQLKMDFRECNGNLYKSCILGLMSFNLTKQIQQCTDGMESSTPKQEPSGKKTVIIAMIVAGIIVIVIIVCLCNRRKIIECLGCGGYLSVRSDDLNT